MNLDDGKIWFVRRDSGRGVHPVSAEGWSALALIAFGTVMSIVAALVIKVAVPEPSWLWLAVFVIVVVGDAMAFFIIARLKTDTTVTLSQYRARQGRAS